MQSLNGEDYLSRTGCEYQGHIGDKLREMDVRLNVRHRSPREDWVQHMILAGMGISLMPQCLIATPGPPSRVIVEPQIDRNVRLVTVAGRQYSAALRAFLNVATSFRGELR